MAPYIEAMLSPDELARYQRQILLPELGAEGQERLRDASALVVGAGGLGSPVLFYLAAAGVGTLGIVDSDSVEQHNLHRQILHGTRDIGRAKTASAADTIAQLNPHVRIQQHAERLDAARARTLVSEYDLVIDGSDNFATRYAINDACAGAGTPWVYGSVERFSGQVSVFGAPDGPCYRCVYPAAPTPGSTASCEEIGVLGAIPGVIGSLQATEALKWITGIGAPLVGRLLQLDLLRGNSRWVRVHRDPACPACGNARRSVPVDAERDALPPFDVEPRELSTRLSEMPRLQLLDIREPWEVSRAGIAGARVLPMGEIEEKLDLLDRNAELIVFCHHGVRSRAATDWLRGQGFRARNLAGGIDRWSREIDPTVPRY